MEGKSIFISSCSRRQLARRRPQARATALRVQLLLALLVLAVGLGAFVAGHGGI
jgi:hypothetical protein